MTGVDEQLKFIVGFAEADLDAYRPGDWQNLRDDLILFLQDGLGPGELLLSGGEKYMGVEMPTDVETALRELQTELHKVFETCDKGREPGPVWQMHSVPIAVRRSTITLSDDVVSCTISGPLRDLVLEKSYGLLLRKGLRPIQRCPVCGRLFYRVRKQQYCQRSCFTKAWVKTTKGRTLKKTADQKSAKKRRLDKAKAKHGQ